MLFSEDFAMQWKSVRDYIASTMIKDTINGASVKYDSLCSVYKNETLRWSLDGQYNALWLDKLRQADPAVAERFWNELNSFTFQRAEAASSSNILPAALSVAGVAAGAAVGFPLHWQVWPVIGVCCGLGAIGGIIGSKIGNSKHEATRKQEVDAYTRQLDALGEKLKAIVALADGKEPIDM